MQTECITNQYDFEGFDRRRVVAAFDGGATTTDAGTLLLRHVNKAINLFGRGAGRQEQAEPIGIGARGRAEPLPQDRP
jgi:hypothetical protein